MPTAAELDAERNFASGAFDSALKLPVAGWRDISDGSFFNVGYGGYYWSSTADGAHSRYLGFGSFNASKSLTGRAGGVFVRCLKDDTSD